MRMKEPDVSVIIPCYNIKNELLLNLASFRKQIYPKAKYELVIVNDGSTDGTSKIRANHFPDLNIKMVNLKERKNRTIARNRGLNVAEGELIIFCDGDTICYPHFISSHVEQYRNNINTVVSGMSKWPSIFTFVYNDLDPITKKQLKAFLNQHPKLKRKIPLQVREKIPLFKKEDVLSGKIFKYVFYPKWANNVNKIIHEYGLNLKNYPVPWLFFITRNCSVSKEALTETRFDEGLSRWGMDDWQLGYRLHQNGMEFKCTEPTNIHQEHPRNWQERKNDLLLNYQKFSRQFPVLPVYLIGLTHFGWNYYRYSKVIAEYNIAKSEDRTETALFLKYFQGLALEQHDLIVRYGNRGEYAPNWEHRKYLWGKIVYDKLKNYMEDLRKTGQFPYLGDAFSELACLKR